MNSIVRRTLDDMRAYELQCREKGEDVSIYDILQHFKVDTRRVLCDYIEGEFLQLRNIAENTRRGFQTLTHHIRNYNPHTLLSDVSYRYLQNFEAYLRRHGLCSSSITRFLSQLRTVINEAIRCGYIDKNPFSQYRMRHEAGERAHLTAEELRRFAALKPLRPALRTVKDMYLFSVYTGLRHSDVVRVCPSNIATSADGKKFLQIRQQKTGGALNIPVSVLFNGAALDILDRYKPERSDKPYFKTADRAANVLLKELAAAAGIEKRLTFHTARHTCATLLLSMNVPHAIIQNVLGHASIKTTEIYARMESGTVVSELSRVFGAAV